MREDETPGGVKRDLIDQLTAIDPGAPNGSLTELAYRRARETLEQAFLEARNIRLQALDEVRNSREREMTALAESLRNLRLSAEQQISALLQEAETRAESIVEKARRQGRDIVAQATQESERIRAEAADLRNGAERQQQETKALEEGFDSLLQRIADRLHMQEKPDGGWLRRLTHRER